MGESPFIEGGSRSVGAARSQMSDLRDETDGCLRAYRLYQREVSEV